jgi:metal-dependent amidase/aminoacylase/carboxypeptidase family protein
MGATAYIHYDEDGYPTTTNTPQWSERVRETAQELLDPDATPDVAPSLGGEDFSRFLLEYPGAYYWLGMANPDSEERRRRHDSRFDMDEAALKIGMELIAQIAIDALYQLQDQEHA